MDLNNDALEPASTPDTLAGRATRTMLTRRNVVKTTAWAVPAITVATTAPAFAYGPPVWTVTNTGSYRGTSAAATDRTYSSAGDWAVLNFTITVAADSDPLENPAITVSPTATGSNGLTVDATTSAPGFTPTATTTTDSTPIIWTRSAPIPSGSSLDVSLVFSGGSWASADFPSAGLANAVSFSASNADAPVTFKAFPANSYGFNATGKYDLLAPAGATSPTSAPASGAATLGASPFALTFDDLGATLPAGVGGYTGATATSLGTAASYAGSPGTTTVSNWTATGGGYKNVASASLGSTATAAAQASATDRALGLRQTGSIGDTSAGAGGAAFTFQFDSTEGKANFQVSFDLQSLDASSPRTATWVLEYGTGASPTTWNSITPTSPATALTTGGSQFSSTSVSATLPAGFAGVAGTVWLRLRCSGTTGSGNRPTSAIDNFSLSWV